MGKKKSGAVSTAEASEPGVIYIGRVPHGFHEHEMRAYFSQFGDVNKVRLSRSKKTGNSKHYAFIEFASAEVARIAASTMDNYLLFGHILRCKLVPPEAVHPELWEGANRRFKKIPRNALEGRALSAPRSASQWAKRIGTEERRRERKQEKLKAMGYEFEAPALQRPEEVITPRPAKEALAIEANGPESDIKASEHRQASVVAESAPSSISAQAESPEPSTKRKKTSKKQKPLKRVKAD